jgi:hypothetical protein
VSHVTHVSRLLVHTIYEVSPVVKFWVDGFGVLGFRVKVKAGEASWGSQLQAK